MKTKRIYRYLAFILITILISTAYSYPNYAATQKTSSQVRLLIASYDNGSVAQAKRLFTNAGAKVTTTTQPASKIDPSKYDGLIIPGSTHDVWPGFYGQKTTRAKSCNKAFDKYRFKMIKKFVLAGKPVYGICGGVQSINVLFGGTLVQHINNHMGTWRNVTISKSSTNYKLFGKQLNAYHSHHECVSKIAPDFIITEKDAKDKHVEAIKHSKYPIYGVQYHPEFMGNNGIKIAQQFMQICRQYKQHPIKPKASEFHFIKY